MAAVQECTAAFFMPAVIHDAVPVIGRPGFRAAFFSDDLLFRPPGLLLRRRNVAKGNHFLPESSWLLL
jgi:hypothetical protein